MRPVKRIPHCVRGALCAPLTGRRERWGGGQEAGRASVVRMDDRSIDKDPTPYADLNLVLGELVARVQSALASNLIGVYLQGSLAIGDFHIYSDVDFDIIVEEDVSNTQVSSLQALHREIFALSSPWAQHLEGSYIPKAALKNLPPPVRKFWYLDNGSKELVRSDHDDSLVVYWVLREKGITLIGPEPRTLISPVSVAALRREILETMRTWRQQWLAEPDKMNNRFYQPFAILSYCRMLHTLQVGAVDSKRAGAVWAKEALDGRWAQLIDQALDARPGDSAEKVHQRADAGALKRTWEFMEYAVDLGPKLLEISE